jgi:hypothetical protein
VSIKISDGISPELKRIADEVKRPKTLLQAGAKAVQMSIKKKLKELQAKGNAKGWPSAKFFAGGKNSVEKNVGIVSVTDEMAVIDIADVRFAHHVKGGEVRAKRSKYLTIPLTAQAYAMGGKGTLRESWPQLKLISLSGGRRYLATIEGKTVTFHFVLKESVVHKPHPDSLPDAKVLQRDAEEAMIKVGNLLLRAQK